MTERMNPALMNPPRPSRSKNIPFIGMALVGVLPGPLKRAYYRLQGANIGKGVKLGMFSYIASPSITLGDNAQVGPFTFIRAHERCRIGARSFVRALCAIDTGIFEMNEDSEIGEQVVVGGMLTPRSRLCIGSRSKIFSFSFINPTEPVTIGDEVCIGGGVYLFTHSSWSSALDGFPQAFGPVTVENGAWLAWRCFVLPHVTIGEYATVGAGSVVAGDVAARTLVAGTPAKLLKQGPDYIQPLTFQQQHSMVLQWMGEFAEYQRYMGENCQLTPHDNAASLLLSGRNGGLIVCRFDASATVPPQADLLLSFSPITAEERAILKAKGKGWFDIASRETYISEHKLWAEFRQFLIRYGLRFKVVG